MHVPYWLVVLLLPVWLWPISLPLFLCLIWLAVRLRGPGRWLALAGVAVLVTPPLSAAGIVAFVSVRADAQRRSEYARTHSVLDQETALDEVTFPAGTEITWSNDARTRWFSAEPRQAIDFLRFRVSRVTRAQEGWHIILAEPRRIGDWNCAAGPSHVTGDGDLVSCDLSDAVIWRGWTLPAQSTVTLNRDRTLDVSLRQAGKIEGQENWRSLADPLRLNDDGSPARARFTRDEPLRIAGVPLWGDVSWNYDPMTLGQGQNRPAETIAGRTLAAAQSGNDLEREKPETEEVIVVVTTGVVTRRLPGNQ